jgi:hypothetical protein
MFDFMAIAKLANPETMAKAMEFMNAWIAFMNKVGKRIEDLIAAVERVDNKASLQLDELETIKEQLTILVSETNLTPQLHERVAAMAADDPRQREMIPGSKLDFHAMTVETLRERMQNAARPDQ